MSGHDILIAQLRERAEKAERELHVAEALLAFERVTIAEMKLEAHHLRVSLHLAREERDEARLDGRIDTLRGIFLGAYLKRTDGQRYGSYVTTMLRWIEEKALIALFALGQEDARRILAEREEYANG